MLNDIINTSISLWLKCTACTVLYEQTVNIYILLSTLLRRKICCPGVTHPNWRVIARNRPVSVQRLLLVGSKDRDNACYSSTVVPPCPFMSGHSLRSCGVWIRFLLVVQMCTVISKISKKCLMQYRESLYTCTPTNIKTTTIVMVIDVFMYSHTYSKSMDQPGKVASPARGQLNRKNEYFPVGVRAWEFGLARRVRQSRPASACSSPYSAWIWCLLTGFLPSSAAVSIYSSITTAIRHRVSPEFIGSRNNCVPMAFTAESPPARGQ